MGNVVFDTCEEPRDLTDEIETLAEEYCRDNQFRDYNISRGLYDVKCDLKLLRICCLAALKNGKNFLINVFDVALTFVLLLSSLVMWPFKRRNHVGGIQNLHFDIHTNNEQQQQLEE